MNPPRCPIIAGRPFLTSCSGDVAVLSTRNSNCQRGPTVVKPEDFLEAVDLVGCGVSIPVVIPTAANNLAAGFLQLADQVRAPHPMGNSATRRIPGISPPIRSV